MSSGDIALLAWSDYVGITRCRGVPAEQLRDREANGLGWAVAGQAMTPFSQIATNPWGPMLEVRQIPDFSTEVFVPGGDGESAFAMVLCDSINPDGTPWDCCPRHYMRSALEDLEAQTGLQLVGAFEHEFLVEGIEDAPAFSVTTMRNAAAFTAELSRSLHAAGLAPETIEPEYGVRQFEISTAPVRGLAIADHAILTRDLVRDVARRCGLRVSFSPKPRPEGVGNGNHVHFSFQDPEGANATHDGDDPQGLSSMARAFIGGVHRHMAAMTVLFAPSPVSYLRLLPQHWSCGFASFGIQNREAALRVCPGTQRDPQQRRRAFNLELRPPDATANPYIVLGSLIRAGLSGIRDGLPLPPAVDVDPATVPLDQRQALGITPLPDSLHSALEAWNGDAEVWDWMPPLMRDAYMEVKLAELAAVDGMSAEEVCRLYASVY